MSYDLLLDARDLTKSYSMSLSSRDLFMEAVFGRKAVKPLHTVLSNVAIQIFRGETVGILGRNGAGKTTLLSILGNVIEPNAGTVERNGRIAVLLAIGAGFNMDFSGRENAELFCSVMGFSRSATAERLDRILEFSELGEYFEMPVRTYSSGMAARLGFSCAINVDADTIIIDETLAVGDASFRIKCYERIKFMQKKGQTFLLVSHSPNVIANFCSRAIVLEKGRKVFDGAPLDALNIYKDIRENLNSGRPASISTESSIVKSAKLSLEPGEFIEIQKETFPNICIFHCRLIAHMDVEHPIVSFGIRNQESIGVCSYDSAQNLVAIKPLKAGEHVLLKIEFKNYLLPGSYFISGRVAEQVGDVAVTLGTHYSLARFDNVGPQTSAGIVNLEMKLEVASQKATTLIQATT